MAEAKVLKAKAPVPSRDVGGKKMRTRDVGPSHLPAMRRLLHVMVTAVFLTIVTAPTLLPKFSVVDNDIWLHLKVGDWILEHSSVPRTGILSRTTADRPWAAYSWFYELLLSLFHSRFHLAGISVYGLLLTVAVAYSIFWMTRRLSGTFWKACILATLTCAAFLFRVFPRPVFFSMTLFTLTLTLLLEARRTGRPQLLYWLPPIFVLWANTHIQFIYGIFTLGLFVLVSVLQEVGARRNFRQDWLMAPSLPIRTLLILFVACAVATCIGPYSYHLYFVVFDYARSTFPYNHIREFQALDFRNYTDFVQLLVTGFAFFTLGRQKVLDLFLLALLCAASIIGFRSQRDAWFVCIPAAACLALAFAGAQRENHNNETWGERADLAISLALLIFLYGRALGFNSQNLRLAVASRYPVQAINFLRDHPQPGPLYNTYDWGDFIAWYMPNLPVAIDGRTDLYGDELDSLFIMTEDGSVSWNDNPYLRDAQVFLLPKDKPLTNFLASDPRFDLIYQDSLAVVLVRKQSDAAPVGRN